ncbi:GNAT family N-acetyltransferase [Micromonospora sp. WMMD882]|uniref:GNAT family N-acetyltransferase n=1 Tax=Micromonospora sp. WMMD882 TaxID=3015151 RepID=UPI00248AF46E|nr:GNAT family N-acetyltransferase [Micromonospora sp. WMMD882]WBB79325.1 GNAT family N-acetyltransferase [Micromonospora sp. WMMD882]
MLRQQDVGHRIVVRRIVGIREGRPLFSDALGELVELSETHITLATDQGRLRVPRDEVHRAKRVPPARRPTAAAVTALELAADEAWPAPVRGRLGDWLLRSAAGWTGRANSALPVGDPDRPLPAAVDAVERWYAGQGQPALVNTPLPLAAPVGAELDARGWAARPPVLVQTVPLARLLADPPPAGPAAPGSTPPASTPPAGPAAPGSTPPASTPPAPAQPTPTPGLPAGPGPVAGQPAQPGPVPPPGRAERGPAEPGPTQFGRAESGPTQPGRAEPATGAPGWAGSRVELVDAPSPEWLTVAAGRKGGLPEAARHVLTAVDQVRFAHGYVDGTLVAVGRGTVTGQGRWLGLSLVEVAPSAQRRGLARAVIRALAEWAAETGATDAFLQVEQQNLPAVSLYRSLGFTTHHTYLTRVAPT